MLGMTLVSYAPHEGRPQYTHRTGQIAMCTPTFEKQRRGSEHN